jgi:hypothetical protein
MFYQIVTQYVHIYTKEVGILSERLYVQIKLNIYTQNDLKRFDPQSRENK